MTDKLYIGLDFDGTVVTHDYPRIGKPLKGCIETLRLLQEKGHFIILNTMRSGQQLQEAVSYLEDNGINLYGINSNPTQKSWTSSPKVYAHLYIDDAALGCPLIQEYMYQNKIYPVSGENYIIGGMPFGRPYVDWEKISILLRSKKII